MEANRQDADLYVHSLSAFVKPADVSAYFEGVADIESNTSKELTKLGAVIQVPFRPGNQFLGEGGMQVSCLSADKVQELTILGRLLHHSGQDPSHCRHARLACQDHRVFHRPAPSEAACGGQGTPQECSDGHRKTRSFRGS